MIIVPALLPHTTIFMWQRIVVINSNKSNCRRRDTGRGGEGRPNGYRGNGAKEGNPSDDDVYRGNNEMKLVQRPEIVWSEYSTRHQFHHSQGEMNTRLILLVARVVAVDSRNVQICGKCEY